jgi:hypothetical protein
LDRRHVKPFQHNRRLRISLICHRSGQPPRNPRREPCATVDRTPIWLCLSLDPHKTMPALDGKPRTGARDAPAGGAHRASQGCSLAPYARLSPLRSRGLGLRRSSPSARHRERRTQFARRSWVRARRPGIPKYLRGIARMRRLASAPGTAAPRHSYCRVITDCPAHHLRGYNVGDGG